MVVALVGRVSGAW